MVGFHVSCKTALFGCHRQSGRKRHRSPGNVSRVHVLEEILLWLSLLSHSALFL